MADRPILFRAPMVRALLAGTKTQTRRYLDAWCDEPPAFVVNGVITAFDEKDRPYRWPHTKAVGDRLYVREEYSGPHRLTGVKPRDWEPGEPIWYWADGNPADGDWTKPKRGMHMPRWASRITLHVTEVRVQRLQDISEDDACAEGCEPTSCANVLAPKDGFPSYRSAYGILWDSINGDGAWAKNPWVAAYTFTVERGNIDAQPRQTPAVAGDEE